MTTITDKTNHALYTEGVFIDEDEIVSKINVEHIRLLDLDLMTNASVTVIGDLMKLTPLPRTRTEYEKVTESIFDLRDEFERGDLYTKGRGAGGDFFKKITTEYELITFATCGLYRKIEKEIDERQEFIERTRDLIDASREADYSLGKMFDAGCRFVGANGEIE